MKQWITLLLVITILGCKDEKVNLSGDAPVKPNEFVKAFPILSLPFTVADTNLTKIGDSTTISAAVLQQFVPDSTIKIFANTGKKYVVHPIGRIEKTTENYLLATITQNKKIQIVAFVSHHSLCVLIRILLLFSTHHYDSSFVIPDRNNQNTQLALHYKNSL